MFLFTEPDGSDVQDSGGRSATATRSLQHTTKTTLSQVSYTNRTIDPVPNRVHSFDDPLPNV